MTDFPSPMPVFSLPNMVLLPQADLPLRVFDPVYKQIVEHALDGNRMMVICLMKHPWNQKTDLQPKLHSIGTVGIIIAHHELKGKGHHIFVRGLGKVRLGTDITVKPFHMVEVETLADEETDPNDEVMLEIREQIMKRLYQSSCQDLLGPFPAGMLERLGGASNANFIALATNLLTFTPSEQQMLLEQDGTKKRIKTLAETLNMNLLKRAKLGDRIADEGGYTH